VLSGFSPESLLPFASEINPATVQITPSAAGLTGSLLFTYNGTAAGGVLESIFSMTIAPDLGAVEKVDLQLIGASATGDGVVTGVADVCDAGFLGGVCTGTSQPIIALVDSLNNVSPGSAIIGPLASYALLQDIVIDGGLSGTATLTAAQLTFTAVPEPATLATLATGLLVTLVLRRRRRSH
jgi:hypothetical protein